MSSSLFIHSAIKEHFGCFPCLGMMNRIATKILVLSPTSAVVAHPLLPFLFGMLTVCLAHVLGGIWWNEITWSWAESALEFLPLGALWLSHLCLWEIQDPVGTRALRAQGATPLGQQTCLSGLGFVLTQGHTSRAPVHTPDSHHFAHPFQYFFLCSETSKKLTAVSLSLSTSVSLSGEWEL